MTGDQRTLLLVLAAGLAGLAVALLPAPRGRPSTLPTARARARPAPATLPWVAAVGAGLLAGAVVGGAGGLVVAVPVGLAARFLLSRLEGAAARARREQLQGALPHAVDLLAAALAAGRAPETAVPEIAEAVGGALGEELSGLARRLRMGVDPVTVWGDLGRHPQLAPLGRAVARAVERGASVADALERLAEDLRREQRGRVEERARSVGVKAAVPLGVCLLPAFMLVAVVPLVAGSLGRLGAP